MPCSQADSITFHESWLEVGLLPGIEDEVANMSQKEQLALSPAYYFDIATGEPIPNARCLYECQELDKTVKK